jgi:hypothetical protein
MAYNPNNANGQTTMANSAPVTIASNQTALSVDTELPAAAALADATANPTTSIVAGADHVFNGTTWDRKRSLDALSGTSANNTVVGIQAVGIGPGFAHRYNPTALATAANSASTVEVEGGNTMVWSLGTTTTGTITFEGTGDATNFYAVEVFDATADIWVSGQNLTPTSGKVYYVACGGLRQVRLRTVTTLGATVTHFINVSASQQILSGMDTGPAPHNFGYTLFHRDRAYTTAQTTTSFYAPTASTKKFAITDLTISTGGTTAAVVNIYDATSATAFAQNTTPAIFTGEFAPSTTSRPGITKNFVVPYVSTTANNNIMITTSAAITIYVQVNGYEI